MTRTKIADIALAPVRFAARNPLLVGLMLAAATLLTLFFVGLAALAPHSPGREVPLSQATRLIGVRGAVEHATLKDEDARIELDTARDTQIWASYPHSDAYTNELLDRLTKARIPTTVDQQAGKPELRIVVQFLLPIMILASLFGLIALLTRDQSGAAFASFSRWTGKGQKARTGPFTFQDVAGAPEALVELQEICDYLEAPVRYARLGARAQIGRAHV